VRGKQKSRKMEEVVNEVKRLLNNGVREITLLGQQVNAYGEDFPGGMDLSRLLWEINRIDTPFWVRFITAHPKKMKEDLIYAMASLKKVCEHLHLPLQAGSDKILQRMRRGYTFENYLKVVETIRGVIPDLAITTDIIVGFPGEDEMDFKKTLVALEEIRFDGAFIFKYSPRPKTKASSFIDDVQDEVKKARLSELVELQGKITEEKNRELIGKVEEVLVFERNPKGKGVLGRTRTNKTVVFDGEDEIIGEFVKVRITDAGRWHLKGRRFEDAT
jgi:tRNA-2-methylthio-N6-dimethylallyladenosine synthase